MLSKAKKIEIVNKLSDEFKDSQAIVVANFKGISHKNLEELRILALDNEVKVSVIKNTLANIALDLMQTYTSSLRLIGLRFHTFPHLCSGQPWA